MITKEQRAAFRAQIAAWRAAGEGRISDVHLEQALDALEEAETRLDESLLVEAKALAENEALTDKLHDSRADNARLRSAVRRLRGTLALIGRSAQLGPTPSLREAALAALADTAEYEEEGT